MTELRRVIWDWEPAIAQLRGEEPVPGFLLQLACRPIAADRQRDGKLLLVAGCWLRRACALLSVESTRGRLAHRLSALLDDRIELLIVEWPGRMLDDADEDAQLLDNVLAKLDAGTPPELALPATVYANPPNPVADLGPVDPAVLEESHKCEGALDRLLFAELVKRGVQPVCQYPVLNYRLDVALPDRRIAADVDRWQPRSGRRPEEVRLRAAALEDEGWSYITFAGVQIQQDAAGCAERLLRLRPGRGPTPPSGGPLSIGSLRRSPRRDGGSDGRRR